MGGAKKQNAGYYYFLGWHMIFCHGPIDSISHILADDKTAWSGWNDGNTPIIFFNNNLFGGPEKEGGLSGQFDIEFGKPTQAQNAYLPGVIPGELIPNFRGVFGIVARQVYVGTTTYLKKIGVRAQRIHKRTSEGIAQWYDSRAEILYGDPTEIVVGMSWKYKQVLLTDVTDYSDPAYDDSAWSVGTAPFLDRAMPVGGVPDGFLLNPGTVITRNRKTWMRKTFTLSLLSSPTARLEIYSDDHYSVWLNGTLLGTGGSMDPLGDPLAFYFIADIPPGMLVNGTNTIVLMSSDLVDSVVYPGNRAYADLRMKVVIQKDMNPAHIIRECLTDSKWGMGYSDADIDDTAFQAAANTLYSEGMGMSILWNKQTAIQDFINEVAKHIDGSIYLDKSSGKFVLKLMRYDYDPATLPVLDPSNIDYISDYTEPKFGELVTSVTVNYWDAATYRDASLTVQDIALSQMQQAEINTTLEYPGFTNAALASRIAQRDLKTLSTPMVSCTVYTNRDGKDLNIGSVVKVTWPDYNMNALIMRVVGIAYGDGKMNRVRIQLTQDIYGTPAVALISDEPPYVPPSVDPVPATKRLVYEVPYYEAVQQQGQAAIDALVAVNDDIGYVGAAAGQPANGINAEMYADSGGGYLYAATFDFSPSATLTSTLDEMTTTFAIGNVSNIENAPDGTFFQMGNEIMAKVSYLAPNLTVKRGVLDTVPAKHSAAEVLYFWDVYGTQYTTQFVNGETINVKILPTTFGGTLPLAGAPADSRLIVGRLARPYPPGNLKINGSYFPANALDNLNLTWVSRNRKTQLGGALVGFPDATITAEPGTTYNVRVFDNATNSLLINHTGITILSDSAAPSVDGLMRIEVEAQRDGLVSYQAQTAYVNFTATKGRIVEDASGYRITETGDRRILE